MIKIYQIMPRVSTQIVVSVSHHVVWFPTFRVLWQSAWCRVTTSLFTNTVIFCVVFHVCWRYFILLIRNVTSFHRNYILRYIIVFFREDTDSEASFSCILQFTKCRVAKNKGWKAETCLKFSRKITEVVKYIYYENTHIQIYRKNHLQKLKIFR